MPFEFREFTLSTIIIVEGVKPVASITTTCSKSNDTFNKVTSLQMTESSASTQSPDNYQLVTEHKRTLKQVRFVKDQAGTKRPMPMSKSLNSLIQKFSKSESDEDERLVITGSGYIVRGSNSEILNLNGFTSASSMTNLLFNGKTQSDKGTLPLCCLLSCVQSMSPSWQDLNRPCLNVRCRVWVSS
jgi:hypothetical protein